MRAWLNRVAGLLVGSLLVYSSVSQGLYVPNTAQAVGFDLATAAIAALGGWAIYRGFRPKQTPTAKAPAERV